MSESNENISFAVQGDIDLDTFAMAVDGLKQLAKSLAHDLAPHVDIQWELAGLEFGSATVTLRPVSSSHAANRRLSRAYHEIGKAIATDRPLRYSDGIRNAAQQLARLSNRRRVKAVYFTSQGKPATVSSLGRHAASAIPATVTRGSVSGVVESLSRRGDLHLTLIDDVFSSRVSLHLRKGQEEEGRRVWDRHVSVTGLVTEDPGTGRPTDVRNISEIEPTPAFEPGAWRAARGAFPWQPGDPPAEQQLRETRSRG